MSDYFANDVVLPPSSKEAEESVIGAALVNPDCLDEIPLEESDFYFSAPKLSWRAIAQLRQAKQPVDFVTLTTQLERNGDLEAVGGAANIAGMLNATPSFNLEAYARIVKEKSRRRLLLEQANNLAKLAYNEERDVDEGVTDVVDNIVNSVGGIDEGARHIRYALTDLYEYVVARREHPSAIWGVPTGFKDIDVFLGGLHPGESTYLAGEPGVGKSKLAMQMGVNAALPENGKHSVAIYSLEMKELQVIMRMVSSRRNVTTYQMNSGKMSDEEFQKFCGDIEYMEQLPIYIYDRVLTPLTFHADVARKKKKFDIELVVLDYLLLMSGYDNLEETPRSGILSRLVKETAQSLNVPILSVSSVTKDQIGSTDSPTNKTMRGSAQVIHDADNIAFLTPAGAGAPINMMNLTFTKTRSVARGVTMVNILADNNYPIFKDVDSVKTINTDSLRFP